jgi:hypothetical protein
MKFVRQVVRFVALAFLCSIFLSQKCLAASGTNLNAGLAKQILADKRLNQVEAMALKLLSGFNAGTSYGEIWIRDYNTFIDGSPRWARRGRIIL